MDEILRTEDACPDGLTEEQMRQNVINLAFGGDEDKFQEFCDLINVAVPPGTSAVLRGSSITGERYDDGAPFDADGPGTSDLDLTLVGDEIVGFYDLTGYYLPGVHTMPMGEDHPGRRGAVLAARVQVGGGRCERPTRQCSAGSRRGG